MARTPVMTALLLAGAALTGVAQGSQSPPLDARVAEQIRTRIEVAGVATDFEAALARFYVRRAYRPAWSNEHGPNQLTDDLVAVLSRADLEGLRPDDYHLAAITTLLAVVRADVASGQAANADRVAELDLQLTDAFLLYGSQLLAGRVDPETLSPRWVANRRGADLATVLEDALGARDLARALQRLTPTQSGYRRLREALVRERAVVLSGGWPTLPDGPALKLGDRGSSVAILRERLRIGGDPTPAEPGEDAGLFDESLAQAVRQFQEHHGLDVSGQVDAATRAELNVSAERRAEQLRLNLERWRWLPQDLGRRHIIVNIAAYQLEVIEDEEVVLAMRVVVGRRYRRTPVFSDTVRYVVLNPYWHVPRSIAVQDLLPKIQHDPSYLKRYQIGVFDGSAPVQPEVDPTTVDWSAVTPATFHYQLHQRPGPLNALGRIKFMFPNKYDVYLHDTPSKALFDESQRDFSHGCIRIEKPLDLATYLLKKSGGWNRLTLEHALAEGTERTVPLARPMPIHILYWTAWADQDGTIQFRSDIHGLDQLLSEALDAPIQKKG